MTTQNEFTKSDHIDVPKTVTAQVVYGRLASVFTDVLGVSLDHIHPDLGPTEVERWDSVGHVVLVTAIEEEFSIRFEADEIMEFTSFKNIHMVVAQRISASTKEMCDGPGGRA